MQQGEVKSAQPPAPFPDWDSFPQAYAAQLESIYSDREAALKEGALVATHCRDIQPEPVAPLPAEGPESRAAVAWFKEVLLAIEKDCLGFDTSQAVAAAAHFTRLPIRLFSETAYLLALRMPVGRFVRQARFLVDLEASDGQRVIPLDGRAHPFHARAAFYRSRQGRALEDTACIADYARIFCQALSGDYAGSSRFFVPIETPQQVEEVAIGPVPPHVMNAIRPFARHTGPDGFSTTPGTIHLFSGPMFFGTPLFRILLMLIVPDGDGAMAIAMVEDQQIADNLPIVPIAPDPLTFAYFPLRSAGA